MKTTKDYDDLYLKCDVFEKFRNDSLSNCGLCPTHYLRAPALSLDAMLNMTKVQLELIPDSDVAHISNRYSKAKNKYLKYCDPKQESKHILYLDANNLYRYAISKFLPTSGFKWIDPKVFDLNKYTSNSSK